jgi:hypothetical protein
MSRVDQLAKPADLFALTSERRRNRTMIASQVISHELLGNNLSRPRAAAYCVPPDDYWLMTKLVKPLPLSVGHDWVVEVKVSVKPLPQV